MLAQLEQAALE